MFTFLRFEIQRSLSHLEVVNRVSEKQLQVGKIQIK